MTTTTDRLIAQRVLVRDMPDRSRIVATLRIERLAGNAHPHFSATADVYDAHGTHSGAVRARHGREPDATGMMHEEILRAFPGAVAFVRMHLSDYPSGEPMHAEANAWYFLTRECADHEARYGGDAWTLRHGNAPTRAARLLRLESPDALPYGWLRLAGQLASDDPRRADFARFVDDQRPRWAAEARAAHELLRMMPDVESLRGYDLHGEPIDREPLPAWLTGADPEIVDV